MTDRSEERPVVAVHACADETEAEVIMALLRDRGIESFTTPQVSRWILPIPAGILGEISIYVDKALAEKAIQAIDESGGG